MITAISHQSEPHAFDVFNCALKSETWLANATIDKGRMLDYVISKVPYHDSKWAKVVLDAGAEADYRIGDIQNPLHLAIDRHYPFEIVYAILRAGEDVDDTDHYGDTPLHTAAKNREVEVIELLITWCADTEARNKLNLTSFHCVYFHDPTKAWEEARQSAEMLAGLGADIRATFEFHDKLFTATNIWMAWISYTLGFESLHRKYKDNVLEILEMGFE